MKECMHGERRQRLERAVGLDYPFVGGRPQPAAQTPFCREFSIVPQKLQIILSFLHCEKDKLRVELSEAVADA